MARYVEVAVQLPVRGTFHYAVPESIEAGARVGARVIAPFGARRATGVIVAEAESAPAEVTRVRELDKLLDEPPVSSELIALCLWIADYYEAPPGEVLRAALPAGSARDRDRARVRPRTERVARVARAPSAEEAARLGRAPRQQEVLEALAAAGGVATVAELEARVARAGVHLRALARAGLVAVEERVVAALPAVRSQEAAGMIAPVAPPPLTAPQEAAAAAIRAGLEARSFRGFLLHGVTGSGKTEVYLGAIADVVAAGRTALVLVPEISLTPQLAARFRARFGDRVAVLHSGLTDRERFDEWHRLQRGDARIALGARSAIYAPVADLGIVVVDEEHDGSFKQEEGVRYHARDVALVRAKRAGAVCVLGSATPALESYHSARTGRLELLELAERATRVPLPAVELIDLRTYQPDPESFLTAPLAQAVAETLERREQVILFLNRRGFNTFVLCVACGQAFRCRQCAVSLTYHRSVERMLCHYCGHAERIPPRCPACGADAIARRGLGTERVAAGLAARFPEARVGRLDRDLGGGRRVSELLGQMARGEIDLLVGTQMVTKGHDFPAVTLVGVLCADTGLSLPDFRAAERTFQLLAQVAGRAGRADLPGRVLIQSYQVESPAIAAAGTHDYAGFCRRELESRRELGYPPFGHLVAIRIDGTDARAVETRARTLAQRASAIAAAGGREVRILGPSEAPLSRLRGRTRWHLWLRAGERRAIRGVLRALLAADEPGGGRVRVSVDVDPVSAL